MKGFCGDGMGSIKWLSHSGFEINSDDKKLLIDPFLNGNPNSPVEVEELKNVDIVCVTHDHEDHVGDAIEICKKYSATFVGIFELNEYAKSKGVESTIGLNIGGTIDLEGTEITLVKAFHSSERSAPGGYIIETSETKIYHAGDTDVFGDMKLIRDIYNPKIACIPIGGYYTMGTKGAIEATKLIQPDIVIPMHYQTFPVLKKSAKDFEKLLKEKIPRVKPVILKPGGEYEF